MPSFAQTKRLMLPQYEKELVAISAKVKANIGSDSLTYYSHLFDQRMNQLVNNNPVSLDYAFTMLVDSYACMIETSEDGLFRIYSWDTWTGGTMHFYHSVFQFKTDNTVKTFNPQYDETDPQNYYSDIFTLKTAGGRTYYLVISNGRYSTKYMSQTIKIFAIRGAVLDENVKLIKTKSGLQNTIDVEYDYFSIKDKLTYRDQLIHYDKMQKIIYIPVIYGDNDRGQVSGKFIRYQFKGKYFERI